MDHQVEHHSHVGRAESVPAGANRLDIFWIAKVWNGSGKSRIEALDVSDLQHQVALLRQGDQFIGLAGIQAEGFFHQEMRIRFKEIFCQLIMASRGCGDHRGVDFSEKVAIIGQSRATAFGGYALTIGRQGIDYGGQILLRHFCQFLGVKST